MEPFGLFQILQSFLGQNPENAPQAEESAAQNENPAKESAPQEIDVPQSSPEPDSSNQAILSFMQAHETRAKRIKKL